MARQKGEVIRQDHLSLKTEFPSSSAGTEELTQDLINRKRIIYRSKQRGWLEVDLLLGSWAEKNVRDLNDEELAQYEAILNQETIHIFNYISGKDPIPKELDTPMMKRLQTYCNSSPLGQASVVGFEQNKKYMSN